jgi:Xaa-Pro dipeptidase
VLEPLPTMREKMSSPFLSSFVAPSRRDFLQGAAASSAFLLSTPVSASPEGDSASLPAAFANLKPLGNRVRPIQEEEFRSRLAHAQKKMAEAQPPFDALFLAPGTALYYFTGIRWGLSERLLGLLIPQDGQPILVVPAFEEGRLREKLKFPVEVRTWQEDESPTKIAAAALADRGVRTGQIGIEETVGYSFFDHFRNAAPGFAFVSADPVTIACRAHKSPHELELMRLACDATFEVFAAVFASLKEGLSQDDLGRLVEAGFAKMNLRGGALTLIGESAALPHGTLQPRTLKPGDVGLIDGGCTLEGYESDITRMGVLGVPSKKVREVFEIVRQAQNAALDAARTGKLSGTVDDAARAVITKADYGPSYKYFTHRLGHGIGLDGHEHPYLVRGSTTILEPTMTFSNEPGIYIPGEFGVRCEDDMVITPEGPAKLLPKASKPRWKSRWTWFKGCSGGSSEPCL